MARIWGIRSALELYDEKLATWSSTVIERTGDDSLPVNFMSDGCVSFHYDDETNYLYLLDNAFVEHVHRAYVWRALHMPCDVLCTCLVTCHVQAL